VLVLMQVGPCRSLLELLLAVMAELHVRVVELVLLAVVC
jgi:hypothetical protein